MSVACLRAPKVGDNKVAALSCLAAYGFPTLLIRVIYAPGLTVSQSVLRTSNEFRRFLLEKANYPTFGKPLEGAHSFGSIALARVEPATGMLVRRDGREIEIDKFIAEIERHHLEGDLCQQFMTPPPEVAAICGDRIATLRVVTLQAENDPTLFRVCWKIPAAGNFADNFWRAGNLLGTVHRDVGGLMRAVSGSGLELTEISHDPDTGAGLVDVAVPGFDAMAALAIDAARFMRWASLIGWDIAATENGPPIVEVNFNPDLFLNQLADRWDVLECHLLDCLAV